MIKKYLLLFYLVFATSMCLGQSLSKVYHFINEDLPANEFGKSTWGIFYTDQPALIDSAIIKKLAQSKLLNTPDSIKKELIEQLYKMDGGLRHLDWKQASIQHFIIVKNVKQHLFAAKLLPFMYASMKSTAAQWIIQWNKTKPSERLINYCSIPIFSKDEQYVMILRGQSVTSEGWDTLYIYKRETEKWEIIDKIIITSI